IPDIVDDVTNGEADAIRKVILGVTRGKGLIFRLPILESTRERRSLREWASIGRSRSGFSVRIREALYPHGAKGSRWSGIGLSTGIHPKLNLPPWLGFILDNPQGIPCDRFQGQIEEEVERA